MRLTGGKAVGGLLAYCLVVLACLGPAPASADWRFAPVVPKLTAGQQEKLRALVSAGQKAGLRAGVFAKIGDSNTEFAPNLYGLACSKVRVLAPALRRTLGRYNRVRLANERALPGCRPWTSFSRRSSAAQAGVYSTWTVTRVSDLPDEGYWRKPPGCDPDSTPLSCEVDAVRPRYALVMLGTNDLGMDISFGTSPGSQITERMGRVVNALVARRVVPVLSTIPPVIRPEPDRQAAFDAGVARTNRGIWRLARLRGLPMINLWRALQAPSMFNLGLSPDGLHFGVAGSDGQMVGVQPGPTTFADSVDFRPSGLRYGANRRNLIWLRTLAYLDRVTG